MFVKHIAKLVPESNLKSLCSLYLFLLNIFFSVSVFHFSNFMPSTFSWLNIRKLVKQQESFSGWFFFFAKSVVFKTQRQDCGFFSFTKSLIHPQIILVWIQQFWGCLPQYPPAASRLNLAFFSFWRLLLLFVFLNSLQFNLRKRRARTHVRSLTACTQFDFQLRPLAFAPAWFQIGYSLVTGPGMGFGDPCHMRWQYCHFLQSWSSIRILTLTFPL